MRMRAVWNGAVLAESDDTVVVEGNHYFPPESLNRQYFTTSATHTVCPWKGIASYHTVTVDGVANPDAPGSTRIRHRWPARSRTGWRSGTACGWSRSPRPPIGGSGDDRAG
jgi:hypothetical protein